MSAATIKARRKRLLVLADFLEGTVLPMLDGAKFDMGTWGTWRGSSAEPKEIDRASECGFVGCAIGWGYYCPQLRRAGIRRLLIKDSEDSTRWLDDYGPGGPQDPLEDFFGISEDEARETFYPGRYANLRGRRALREAVARLRKLAAAEPPAEVAP